MPHTTSVKSTFIVLFAFCFCLTSSAQERELASKPELWYGVLDVGVTKLRTVVKVTTDAKTGKQTAEMFSPDQTDKGFPATEFEIKGDKMTWSVKNLAASFEGNLNDKKDRIEGTFKQAGREIELVLERVEEIPEPKVLERWKGKLDLGAIKLKIQLRKLEMDGKTNFVFDSLTEGAKGIPATFEQVENKVTIKVPAIRANFEGELAESKKEIKGTWKQLTTTLDVTFTKVNANEKAKAPDRPQTPKGPFPYKIEEVKVENKSDDVTLAGTLTIPEEGSRFPVAVLVSGSGPQDRDETLLGHKPFHVIADHLSRNGIAVLRYDDRGTAKSTGDFSSATTRDFANDASAAVAYLKNRKEFDPNRIGIIGHSEGGLVGPMVAAENENVGFVIMLAGPGVNGEKIVYDQSRAMAAALGVPKEQLDGQEKAIKKALELSKTAESDEAFNDGIKKMLKEITHELGEEVPPESEEMSVAKFAQFRTPWFRYFLKHEPAPVLSKVKCPLLVLNGELDLQVTHELNIGAIKETLKAAGKQNVTYRVFPKLNHLFQKCKTGSTIEYAEIDETFNQEVLDVMTDWIQSKTKN